MGISQGTKFQLKLEILIFWTKFFKKGYLRRKQKILNFEFQHHNFEFSDEIITKGFFFGRKRKN